jgi:hypothetical protein
MLAHQFELLKACNAELEVANAAYIKRKSRKRKRLQAGGTLTAEEGLQLAAIKDGTAKHRKIYAREGDKAESGALRQRRCGRCGEPGHNARTCNKAEETSSKSDASTVYIFSDSDAAESTNS